MFAATQQDMQRMDRYTMETIGLPGVVLMENAGAKVVEEVLAAGPCPKPKVLVFAGGGNNGGDGFVIARRLHDAGVPAKLILMVQPEKIKGDAKCHLEVYLNRRLPVIHGWEGGLETIQDEVRHADLIVDAMLGTGVRGPVREPYRQAISLINELGGAKPVIAVDIPSGVGSDDGKVAGIAVKATMTVTFVYPKRGFFLQDGPQYVGEWKAVDISVPPSIADDLQLAMPRVLTDAIIKECIPLRPKHGHKGTFGHVLIVGGSRHYVGAPVFAAKAAFHCGAGLVTTAVPESIYPMAAANNPESMYLPLPEENGFFSDKALAQLLPRLEQFRCLAVGPGIGRFPGGGHWLRSLLSALPGQPVVVDADALYLLRHELDAVKQYSGPVLFTPHPGEMAALLNRTVAEVEQDRIGVARSFAETHGVHLLLKGHRSIIAAPDGQVYINPHGHDALGKGGSGDVLTGLIAAWLAQGAGPASALLAASYLHARAGEEMAKMLSNYGVTPLDLVDSVKGLLHGTFSTRDAV